MIWLNYSNTIAITANKCYNVLKRGKGGDALDFYDEYRFKHSADAAYTDGTSTHIHNGYEILYYVRGDAEYVMEGSVYKLRPRDLLFIRPRTFHNLNPLSPAVYERFVIGFPEGKIPEALKEFADGAKEIYRIPEDSPIDRLFTEWSELEDTLSEPELEILLGSAVEKILLYLKYMPSESAVEPIRVNSTLADMLKYIDEHPTEEISAQSLSARFFVSSSWIVHTFKKALGISLMNYVCKKRILYAQNLIQNGENPTEAAKLCNYDDYTTFYRQYKKITGHSPRCDYIYK